MDKRTETRGAQHAGNANFERPSFVDFTSEMPSNEDIEFVREDRDDEDDLDEI